jgi:Ca2+-binding EF-hand superfamily protein
MIDEEGISKSLKETFNGLDTNKDGFLNEAELSNISANAT